MNSQSRDGTQTPELSEAPLSIGTCRHLWGPPGSGDEPPAALVDECRAQRQGEAGVGQLWGIPQRLGCFWILEFVGASNPIEPNSKARKVPANHH